MSKNQRSCDISGDKKTQFCLPTPITLPSSGRDKIEFQFAVPKYRRTHSCRFRFRSPRFWRDFENSGVDASVNSQSAIFFKKLCEAGFRWLSRAATRCFAGCERSAIIVPVNALFSQNFDFRDRVVVARRRRNEAARKDHRRAATRRYVDAAGSARCRRKL